MSEFFIDVIFAGKTVALALANNPNPRVGHVQAYCYRHPEALEPGTAVVVDTPTEGYKIAWVVRSGERGSDEGTKVFHEIVERLGHRVAPAGENLKWLVAAVDDRAYRKRIADRQRAEQIRAQLEKRVKQLAEMRKYEMLSGDEESAKLLAELRDLSDLPEGLKALAAKPE